MYFQLLSESGMSGASRGTVAFLVLLVLSLIGTAGFFFVKSRKKSQSVVQYNTMINDTDGDVEPIDPGTPAATFRNVLPALTNVSHSGSATVMSVTSDANINLKALLM